MVCLWEWVQQKKLSSIHGSVPATWSHTQKSRTPSQLFFCLSNLSKLCCNSTLLFNKQFVSDVLNASSNLIVCEMCAEVLPAPRLSVCTSNSDIQPLLSPAGVCLCAHHVTHVHEHFSACVCVNQDEDGRAILKALQLHLNSIIRHDGWLFLSAQCLDPHSGSATRL